MKLTTKTLVPFALSLIGLLAIACGTDDGSSAAPSSPTVPTPTATSAGVAPLPSVDIFVGDVGYRGAQIGYCWPDESMPEQAVTVCADPAQGVFPAEEVLVAGGMKPRVVVDSVSPPTRLTANVYADPTMPAIKQINIGNEANRELDVDFVRGGYYLRIHGEWPEGQADYGFRIVRLPHADAFTAECMYTEAKPLPITYDVLADETPTEFDGRNKASCTFSKPVKLINVTLTGGLGSVHSQSFHFNEPCVEIEFPLSEWDESESILELLAPATYTRTMKAVSADDEEWVITDHIDAALDEVTVVESATPTPLPAKEWEVEDVSVEGSTVRVIVRIHATADLSVLIDGEEPDDVEHTLPLIHHVFHNVSSGTHELSIFDVVGHTYGQPLQIP